MRIVSASIILFIILGGEWKATQCGTGFWHLTLIDGVQFYRMNGNIHFDNEYGLGVVSGGRSETILCGDFGPIPTSRIEHIPVHRILEYAHDDKKVYFLFEDKSENRYLGDIGRVLMSREELSRYLPQMDEIYKFPTTATPISEAKSVYESLDWIELRSDVCENIRLSRLLLIGAFLFLFGKLLRMAFRKLRGL